MGDVPTLTTRGGVTRRRTSIIVAVVFGLVALWWVAPWHAGQPITLTGSAWVNHDATAIGFRADSTLQRWRFGLSEGNGFNVMGVSWSQGRDGTIHLDGEPSVGCLEPLATNRVELSYVEARYVSWSDQGGPLHLVTHVTCLD